MTDPFLYSVNDGTETQLQTFCMLRILSLKYVVKIHYHNIYDINHKSTINKSTLITSLSSLPSVIYCNYE